MEGTDKEIRKVNAMKILSNEACDISDYCGNVIVSYLNADAKEALEVKKWLELKGYDYVDNEISPLNLFKGSYCDKYNNLLKNCGLYIFIITKNFNESFRPLINVILYQAGVLEANGKNRIYPYVCQSFFDAEEQEKKRIRAGEDLKNDPYKLIDLEKLPLRDYQRPTTISSLDSKFKEEDHRQISVYDFVKKEVTVDSADNKSSDLKESDKEVEIPSSTVSLFQKFITYRKITVHFYITEDNMNKCMDVTSRNQLKDEDGIVEWLDSGIQCGTRIFAFGNDATITNSTRPYEEESRFEGDIALTIPNGRKFYIKNSDEEYEKTKIKGTLAAEFIIPVHKLLGVYYKCFIRGYDADNPGTSEQVLGIALKDLLESNFNKKNDVALHQSDLYFCFEANNSSEDKYKIAIPTEYGNIANYMHPQ